MYLCPFDGHSCFLDTNSFFSHKPLKFIFSVGILKMYIHHGSWGEYQLRCNRSGERILYANGFCTLTHYNWRAKSQSRISPIGILLRFIYHFDFVPRSAPLVGVRLPSKSPWVRMKSLSSMALFHNNPVYSWVHFLAF